METSPLQRRLNVADEVYRYTFDVLCSLITDTNVVSYPHYSRDECESTLNRLKSILEMMEKQVERMED